ncbi:hypothetical protein CHU98_g2632 [Xylaria longipes]|nr:hypothetical protein CHU98_g2632 [Xylaria longipes]
MASNQNEPVVSEDRRTFLSYLTLPNPKTNSTLRNDGVTTKSARIYSPDGVLRWEDFTLENFERIFKDVVLHEMEEPKVGNAGEITSEDGIIWEESSVRRVVEKWNMEVVQRALDGTHSSCIAKDTSLGKTRYGFIISEEELVAFRLSKFSRDVAARGTTKDESSYARFLRKIPGHDRDNRRKNRIGVLLEFRSVPWASSGVDSFTVNLALWWLSVLAIRDPAPLNEGAPGEHDQLQRNEAQMMPLKKPRSPGGTSDGTQYEIDDPAPWAKKPASQAPERQIA